MKAERDLAIEAQLDDLFEGSEFGDASLARAMRAELRRKLQRASPLTVYLGADPTSPHVHVGHAVVLSALARFQRHGHRVIFLIGDFTALIGDPTGRNKTRPPLSPEAVAANAATYADQAFKVLDRARTEVVFNSAWLAAMTFTDVIGLARCATVAQYLAREDFARRHAEGTPIHLHEMLYALSQGEDAARLRADVQVGGMDQLFNLLAGRDVMRERGLEPQVALTFPLLVGTDGKVKMSKSHGNDVGLTLPPADMYGKVMSIPDEAMTSWIPLASGLPAAQARDRLARVAGGLLPAREAKGELARLVVARWHGEEAARRAEDAFKAQFQRGEVPGDAPALVVGAGTATVLDLVVAASGGGSRSEARRLIESGGVSLDGVCLGDWKAPVPPFEDGAPLRLGKRRWVRLARS